jgi:hypothetical protein
MVHIITPGQSDLLKKLEEEKYVIQIFDLNDHGQVTGAAIYPMPVKGIQDGVTLAQIKIQFEKPFELLLNRALQNDEMKVILRITSLKKLRVDLIKAATMASLKQRQQPPLKDETTQPIINDNKPANEGSENV